MWRITFGDGQSTFFVTDLEDEFSARDIRREMIFGSLENNLGWTICLSRLS